MSKQILILPGDGIGPEIMAEAVKVLTRIDTQHTLGAVSYTHLTLPTILLV